jgi:diaminohydroxyphosphoribosylaminopyrimidine deaminase/5-amino-6-(5-phosphoribosylamino)uracil reductase
MSSPVTSTDLDATMMRRAIRLAMNARGQAEPNPSVGVVIARGDRVIGEGCTSAYGGAHAEPTALAACTESPAGATAYTTLEPCCHTNKKTPPCVPALIAAKIARVVVGCVDPNPSVNGQGIEQLRAAGIAVDCNVLEDPAKQLIAPFIARTVYDRPYVTLKWAESADGKVAGAGGKRAQISNAIATRRVHELRSRSDVIMVGVNTVIADDPMLTSRDVPPAAPHRKLIRVVLDSYLNIPMASKLVRTASQTRVWVYFDGRMADAERERIRALREAGVEPFFADRQSHGLNLDQILVSLGGFDATQVLVEPGPTLARDFFDRQILVDRVWLIRSPNKIGAPTAPAGVPIPGNYQKTGEIDLEGDRLTEYLNPASPVFFAAEPSADFVLAAESKS